MHYSAEIRLEAARLNISPEALQTYLDAGKGKRAPGVVRYLHATIKPIGAACNLDCTYCYYLGKASLLNQNKGRINNELLEKFIADYINSQDVEEIVFTWHGGEPTLLGIDFFRNVLELQKKHTPPGRRVSNDIQTNGTLLDEVWCSFLAENSFLIGLSIDGPRVLHDIYRVTANGTSSFEKVFAAARLLKQYGIIFSTLTTVNWENALKPIEVYRFLRDEVGTSYMQFIPCVEPRRFDDETSDKKTKHLSSQRDRLGQFFWGAMDWSVGSEEWGTFLTKIFDEWYGRDKGRIKINLFESMFAQLRGEQALNCTSSPFCGKNVVLEHDGRVYACDHYVYPEYQIGNIRDQSLGEMVFSLRQLEFGLDKYNSLPKECRGCRYLNLCGGECPRTRILHTRKGEGGLSHLCKGWKMFFEHARIRMTFKDGDKTA
jgi:uncharacterized protein